MISLALVLSTLNDSPYRVLFLGDSITAGYGLSLREAYPQKVQDFLAEKNLSIKSINGGVSGDTTAGGLRRLQWQLKSNPQMVVIALGANDMLRGIPPETTKKNLEQMIKLLKKNKIQVVLLEMQANPTMGRDFVKRFDEIYKKLGKEMAVPVLDFFISEVALKPELNLEDRIHPNGRGQKLIAEKVSRFLEPILRSELEKN